MLRNMLRIGTRQESGHLHVHSIRACASMLLHVVIEDVCVQAAAVRRVVSFARHKRVFLDLQHRARCVRLLQEVVPPSLSRIAAESLLLSL